MSLRPSNSLSRKVNRDGLQMYDNKRAQPTDLDVMMGLPPNQALHPTAYSVRSCVAPASGAGELWRSASRRRN